MLAVSRRACLRAPCLARHVLRLSAGQAIGRTETAIDAGTLAPGSATKGSICSTGGCGSFCHPSPAKFVKAAWAATCASLLLPSPRRGSHKTRRSSIGRRVGRSEVASFRSHRARVLLQEDRNVLRNWMFFGGLRAEALVLWFVVPWRSFSPPSAC